MNDDEIQTALQVSSYTYLDRASLLPDLGSAIDSAGGWMLDRRQISAEAVEMSLEVQQQCLPEIYGALLGSGLELTRESHRMLAERCNCCMHLPRRRGASSIVTIHVEVQFLSDPQQATDGSPEDVAAARHGVDAPRGKLKTSMPPIIIARQLGKTYRSGKIETHALRDATFTVDRGEFIAIVGPSGSGKSTLFYLLGGLTRASGGSVTIDGVDFSSLSDAERTRKRGEKIGFVFQRFNLLPTLTARGNIELAHNIADNGKPLDKSLLTHLAELLRIDARLDSRPSELSGGEQQRVAIARAMITRPAIILADEPTGNLDTENSDTVLEMLRHASKELGQTVLMITHNPEAAAIADRIVYVRDGRLHDTPPPARAPQKGLIGSLLSE